MSIQSMKLVAFFAIIISFLLPASADSLGPISEETPPAICNPGFTVTEIKCIGKYCDKLKIKCEEFGHYSASRATNVVWTGWVSEENKWVRCPGQHYISGFACNGKYCDNLSLLCVKLHNVSPLSKTACKMTAPVSEENGGRLSFFRGDKGGQKFAARSMKCTGKYCDNKRFEVCELRAR